MIRDMPQEFHGSDGSQRLPPERLLPLDAPRGGPNLGPPSHPAGSVAAPPRQGGFMDFLRPELQERLMKEHFEFRKLMEEHKAADSRLGDLQRKPSLSAKESLEEVELKKTKLRAKERIYSIVQEASRHAEQ
ncbi:MAG TPA: hypothetical protein DHV93_00150 [Holophagaceae bacterium]|nr:hypothetical protein [Holophagaceae bacterium]